MRVAITGVPGAQPVVAENVNAFLLVASTDDSGTALSVAHGDQNTIAGMAVSLLGSVRLRLGDRAFDIIVRAARTERPRITDIMEAPDA